MVKTRRFKVIWSDDAKAQLNEIYVHIRKKSEQGAKQVKSTILSSTKILETGKEIYKADLLKTKNDGTYRAYVVYSYKIVYRILDTKILILRVRHTSREPLEH